MTSWGEVEREAPDFAAIVYRCFSTRKHHTLATLRRDGSPRISGSEVEFSDGDIWIGSMPGARKALDLRRDGRFALHSATVDPPADPSMWTGEAKLAGIATEVSDPDLVDQPHRFRLDISEAVFTRVSDDLLVVTSWHPSRGVVEVRRA